jgi:hypothetical protein
MEFGITLEIDSQASSKAEIIQNFSDELSKLICSHSFGVDVEQIIIGFICILTVPGYEEWYKERKPRFTKANKTFCFDIKVDGQKYESFVQGNNNSSRIFLATEILGALTKIDKIPKHVKDFNRDLFKEKITEYLQLNVLSKSAI